MAYENLFQNRGFFRDYEPVVLNTHLPKIAETLRGRYDEGVAAKSLLDRAMGSVRTIGLDDAAINNARMKMDQTINGRVDFENMGKVITDATTGFLTDHNVLNAIDSRKNWEEGEALRTKMTAELGADNVYDFNQRVKKDANGKAEIDPVTGAPIMEHASDSWDSGSKGIYRANIARRQDLEGRIASTIADIQKDGGALIQRAAIASGWTPAELAILNYDMPVYGYTTEGVSKDKVERLTNALAENLYNSPEGRQFIAANDQLFVNPLTGTTYTEDESKGILKKMMRDFGAKQEGMVSKLINLGDSSGIRAGATEPSAPYLPTSVSDSMASNPFEDIAGEKSIRDAFKKKSPLIDPKDSASGAAVHAEDVENKKRAVATTKLLEAYKSGNIMEAVRNSPPNGETFVEFLKANKTLQKDVPRKAGESEENYMVRLGDMFNKMTQPYSLLLEDQTAASNLLKHNFNLAGQGVLFQENGQPADNLKGAIYSQTKKSAGLDAGDTGLFGWGSGVADRFRDTVDPKSGFSGTTTLITHGVNAGRWRHTINYEGTVYSVVIEAYKDQALHFEGLAEIYKLQSSMKKSDKLQKVHIGDKNDPNSQVVMVGNVVETEGSSTRMRTKVALDIGGEVKTMYLEDAESYLTDLYVQTVRRFDSRVADVFQTTTPKNRKTPPQ